MPTPPSSARVAFVSDRSGALRIYLANADGSGVTPLTPGEAPAWSPDGSRIAFHRGGGIYVINADGTNERFLRAGANPSWSPNGEEIAFNSGIASGGGVYVMNADGTNPRLLISHEFASPGWGDYCACGPAWSPAGGTIAFVRANYEEGWGIYTMHADGSGSPSPFPGNGFAAYDPAWSPNGARMAFATARGVHQAEDVIASEAANGSDFRVHVSAGPGGYVGQPAWAPDGRALLFARGVPRGVPTRIHIVSDGSVRQFVPEAQSPAKADYLDGEPSWSWAH
jgi:TolB protein